MPAAIRRYELGGPDVLRYEEFDPGAPGSGEVQIRQSAIGVNFIDIYDRTGLYPSDLPSGLGREAAGVVAAVGRGVSGVRKGDRVAYVFPKPGAYCELRNVPADRLVRIPKGISDRQAAASMLKGLTAQVLLRRVYHVRPGDSILVAPAAGGVGLILCQWAKSLGAEVIGVVGSEEKARVARRNGCRHVLVLGRDDLAASARRLTRGDGVHVVYDGIGKDAFMAGLDSLRPLGTMVTFGNASGPVPPIAPLELARRGSLFLTRPTLFDYIARRADLLRSARELFAAVGSGKVRIRIGQSYRLSEAAQAHRDLESRRTIGSTILLP